MDSLDKESNINSEMLEVYARQLEGLINIKKNITKLYDEHVEIFKRYCKKNNVDEPTTVENIVFWKTDFERLNYKKMINQSKAWNIMDKTGCVSTVSKMNIKIKEEQ